MVLDWTGILRSRASKKLSAVEAYYLEAVQEAAEGMHQLVDELLQFNRAGTIKAFDLHATIQGILKGKEFGILQNIKPGMLPMIETDLRKTRRSFQDVALNALQAKSLELINKELKRFTRSAAPDLIEPLHTIVGYSEALKCRASRKLSGTEIRYVEAIQETSEDMSRLIEGLLRFSKAGTRAGILEFVDLRATIQGVLKEIEPKLLEKTAKVEVGPLPIIEADPCEMRQLFQNFISNALRFTREEEPPKLRICGMHLGKKWVQVSVEDKGTGFDEKFQNDIFRPFFRLGSESKFRGHGLGLATCKKIVEGHGGQIIARSIPNEGSEMYVLLPVKQSAAQAGRCNPVPIVRKSRS